jgi:hypothetical protein
MATDERPPPLLDWYRRYASHDWYWGFSRPGSSWCEPLVTPLRAAWATVFEVAPQLEREAPMRYRAAREKQRINMEFVKGRISYAEAERLCKEVGSREWLLKLLYPQADDPPSPPSNQ